LKCENFGKFINTYLQNKSWCPQGGMSDMSSSSWRSKSFVASRWTGQNHEILEGDAQPLASTQIQTTPCLLQEQGCVCLQLGKF